MTSHFKVLQILVLLLLLGIGARAQDQPADSTEQEDDEPALAIPPLNEKMKLGVKLGVGAYMMGGSEAHSPKPLVGLNGGVYFRYRFNQHLSIQPEVNISFRGGKFNNDPGEYETINTYFLDVPVLLLYGLNEKNTSNIALGAQYAYLLNSSIYKKDAAVAEDQSPALNKNDVMVVVGGQFNTPFVGFQLFLKYGLLNANRGILPSVPPVSTGKEFHHMSFEFDFIF